MSKFSSSSMSLGVLQEDLEKAASELKAAQTVFNSAAARLARADEVYNVAVSSLTAGVLALRAKTKVIPN